MTKQQKPLCIAVLDTMWGGVRDSISARYFRINPHNHSGKRLYWLLNDTHRLLVTNACPAMATTAREHGKPSAKWLAGNLEQLSRFEPKLVLVCGTVAAETFGLVGAEYGCQCIESARVIMMPHPAARMWSRKALDAAQQYIAKDTDHDAILRIVGGDLVINEL